jgi:hypothetical protein
MGKKENAGEIHLCTLVYGGGLNYLWNKGNFPAMDRRLGGLQSQKRDDVLPLPENKPQSSSPQTLTLLTELIHV